MDILESTIMQLNALTRDLTDSSSASLNRFSVTTAPVEYIALVCKCINGFQLIFPDIIIQFNEDRPIILDIDKARIAEVIENVLTNAVKYAGKDKLIEITIEHSPGFVITSIIDHGVGIDEQNLPYIFKRLYRAETEKPDGLGLGLYLCKAIIKAHGGTIGSKNIPGKGACFFLRCR